MKTKSFCLSFEVQDEKTDELYSWLKNNKALECGKAVAFVQNFQYETDFVKEICNELTNPVYSISRLYIAFPDEDGLMKGGFIIGNRKESPWEDQK